MSKAKSAAALSDEDNPLLLSTRSKKHFTLVPARSPDEEIDHIIDYSKASSHQSLRRRMNTFFESSKIDFVLKIINGVFSFYLIIFYILSLYNESILESLAWGVTSFLAHLYLFIEYVARVYASKDRQKYLFSPDSRIDFLSNVFFLAFRIAYLTPFNDDPDNVVLKFGNLLSLLRLLQLENFQRFIENEVNRQLTNIAVVIITLIIFASALLQMIQLIQAKYFFEDDVDEQEKADYTYQYYIFDIIITISTLGYNNPFSGALTKVFLIVLIFVSLFIIPTKSSQLISIFSSKSVYARMRYKTTEHTQHIVVTGTISNASAYDFFNEFFHPDHGGQDRHGIILLPTPPDSVMESMIRHKEFGSNVFYIQGDPLKEADLKRCQAEKAKAIVILCNKQSSDANEEDAKTILQAMFIKKFLKHARAPHVKVCMQILRPEGKTHYYLSLNKQTKSDQVLCVEELKLSLLAKSCLCPGLVSFVANLIASSGEPPKRSESDNEWLEDYWHGKGYEIYKVHLASEFHGEKFAWVASKIYKKFRAILFALELGTGDNTRIYTNPGDYTLPRGNRITAYVISEDKEIADAISEYKAGPQDFEMARRESRKLGAILTKRISRHFPSFMEKSLTVYQEEKSDPDDEEEPADVQFPTKLKQENFNHHLTGEFLNIEDGFHLSPSKINLPDVTFKTMENNILATQHIILCGLVSNLRNFVLPLRAKHLDKYPPIVILHVHPPTEKQWNQVSFFPEIYFVKGSAMNTKDLLRANIHQASRIVILSPEVDEVKHFTSFNENPGANGPEKDNKKLTRDQEDLLDAKTIFKYKAINKLRPDIPIVTELVSPQNLGFFIGNPKDYATMKKYGQINTPIFASGSIYLSSMIDSLICQAYYNPSLITVLNQLIVGSATPKHKDRMDSNDIRGSNLYHFPVPSAFVKQTFEKIFEYLSKYQHIIPVALYRLPGANGNKAPYVVTNPDPETILSQYDVLFILAQKVPPASSSQWGAPFEMRHAKPERGNRGAGIVVKTIQPNQEVAVNYEELGRENRRNKKLNVEGEIAINKVKQIVTSLKKMREDIDALKVELEKRQEQILKSIKNTIYNQIAEMLPEDNKRVVYDDDDMITASPASSVSD